MLPILSFIVFVFTHNKKNNLVLVKTDMTWLNVTGMKQ